MSKFERHQKKGESYYIYPHKHCKTCGQMIEESLTYCAECYQKIKEKKEKKKKKKKRRISNQIKIKRANKLK